MEERRRSIFHIAIDSVNTDLTIENLDPEFDSLKNAAKVNVPCGSALELQKLKLSARESRTLIEGSKLAATKGNLEKLEKRNSPDGIQSSKGERVNTNLNFTICQTDSSFKTYSALLPPIAVPSSSLL